MPGAVEEVWMPEPELREPTPRRVQAAEFPDLNRPNVALFCGIGAVAVVAGIVLFILGVSGRGVLFTVLGIALCLGGGAMLAIFPQRDRTHRSRSENLVMNGVPVMARILGASNLTGDSVHGRSVKYQVTMPGGDLEHREVNCDDRALPKRIPGNATALLDVRTNEVELYCALPYRAAMRPSLAPTDSSSPSAPVTPPLTPTPMPTRPPVAPGGVLPDFQTAPPTAAASATPGRMGTLGDVSAEPPPPTPDSTPPPPPPQEAAPPPKTKPDSQGLPWE